MGPKRASDGDLSQHQQQSKIPKLEHDDAHGFATANQLSARGAPNSDFSGSVKKKLANSTRTGQACDRCKVRKIRCDGRPEGCSPCAQNRTPCKTTDRITGRATIRGHTEATEAENSYLRAQIAELQTQVKEMGAEPRVLAGFNGFTPSMAWPGSNVTAEVWGERRTSASPLTGYVPATGIEGTDFKPLPEFKPGSIGDNYLGVSSADSLLSHIKGTSLSVFGAEIDITDFIENETDYDQSVMSYNHFLKVVLRGEEHVEQVPFPPYRELHEYGTWYLRSLNPYTMLVDKPTFMDLIWKIGNEPGFQPTAAEIVSVHMMLATLKYQISARNGDPSMMDQAHKHYRYSLSFFPQLLHGHEWQDVQALAMVCHHMRNFPKPGAAWIMVSTTFLLAVELGLHRSTKAWADSNKMDKLEIEMRKRIFWTLHALSTNLSGKLGRPMALTVEDIDVEFPEPVNDCLPGEDANLTPFRKCSFQVGIQIAKYTVWSLELFRTIYAVRSSPQMYEQTVRRLEDGIRQWREDIPSELSDPTRASQEDYIFALYLEFWDLEYQLLLHHPAVCRSTNPEFINSNLDKCLAVAQKMLLNCNEMIKIRSLDIPWINAVVYIAAIFTTLFISFQRKDSMTSVDMTKLRSDMSQWVEVMGVCGSLLGSGDNLKIAVGKIVDHSLNNINDSIVKRTATESLAHAALQAPQEQSDPAVYTNGTDYTQYHDANVSAQTYAVAQTAVSVPFSYPNGTSTSVPPHQQHNSSFEQPAYTSGEDPGMSNAHAAALAAAASSAPTPAAAPRPNGSYTYPPSQTPANTTYQEQQHYPGNGVHPNDWHQWSRTNIQQIGPPGEYANTLLTLGSRESVSQASAQDTNGAVQGVGVGEGMPGPGFTHYQWPAVLFNAPPNGHVPQ